MKNFLSKLFNRSGDDGWQQEEREAFIDLMILSMYADGYLSRSEDELLRDIKAEFTWESGTSLMIYADSSIAKVRDAEDKNGKTKVLQSIATRLQTDKARRKAIELCEKMLLADGSQHSVEDSLLIDLKHSFTQV